MWGALGRMAVWSVVVLLWWHCEGWVCAVWSAARDLLRGTLLLKGNWRSDHPSWPPFGFPAPPCVASRPSLT